MCQAIMLISHCWSHYSHTLISGRSGIEISNYKCRVPGRFNFRTDWKKLRSQNIFRYPELTSGTPKISFQKPDNVLISGLEILPVRLSKSDWLSDEAQTETLSSNTVWHRHKIIKLKFDVLYTKFWSKYHHFVRGYCKIWKKLHWNMFKSTGTGKNPQA